jgi:Neurotransmitter-gated ion-channel ligand binding domain
MTNANNGVTTTDRTRVNIDITITDLMGIDISGNQLTLKLDLVTTWSDSRLDFFNLKEDYHDNLVPGVLWADIWTPTLKFWNTKEGVTSDQLAAEPYSRVYVNRSGSETAGHDPSSSLLFNFVYSGRENPLVKESTYFLEFICYYELSWYPFDMQYCAINISLLAQGQVGAAGWVDIFSGVYLLL